MRKHRHKFSVPILVSVEIEVETYGDDVDLGRGASKVVGELLAGRILDTLVPNPVSVKVTEADVGYPEHLSTQKVEER